MTMRASTGSPTFLPGNVLAKTSAYTVTAADSLILCDPTGGAFTVTLPPSASSKYKHVIVINTTGGANAVTLAAAGAELINAANTFTQTAAAGVATHVFCDGTKWYIIGHNH